MGGSLQLLLNYFYYNTRRKAFRRMCIDFTMYNYAILKSRILLKFLFPKFAYSLIQLYK